MGTRGQGRGRGRGLRRPRGSTNKPKTVMWEWEIYKPEPEIYNNLWHLRKAPPTITQNLSNDCPIPNAQSRIVARRQTEDGFCRNFYVVKVRHREFAHRTSQNGDSYIHAVRDGHKDEDGDGDGEEEETMEVDMSVILRYVSQRELERFENAEFRAEAEAEATQRRHEAEDLAKYQLAKNARMPGRGRGGGMLATLNIGQPSRGPGRSRGRGRGRERGRGRGSGGHALGIKLDGPLPGEEEEDAMDLEASVDIANEEAPHRVINETRSWYEIEKDDEEARDKTSSPDLMRSAFVANSALPHSPIAIHRRLSIAHRGHPEVPDIYDSDDQSISSAATQLSTELRMHEQSVSDDSEDMMHRSKRRRTESNSSPAPRNSTSSPRVVVTRPHEFPPQSPQPPPSEPSDESDVEVVEVGEEDSGDDDVQPTDPEAEYVVECILDHSIREGLKYYLVKWAGYEDATDWLEETDLENVPELIHEYNEKIRRRKVKGKGALR